MYVLCKEDGVIVYPYSIASLFSDNPNTLFPAEMPDERLAEWGVYPVVQTQPPSYDPATQVLEQTTAVYNATLQQWETVWVVRGHTAEETNTRADEVRSERNAKLAATDWTQVLDAQVDRTVWAAYRQELRDITAQAGFPWEVVWPQEP